MLIFISLVCNCCCHSFLQETMFCFCANLFPGESYGAAVWQIPELYGQLNSPQLEKIASLDASSCKIKWFVVFDSQFHAIYLWMKRMNRKPTSFIETLLVELHSVLWSPSGRHDKLISIDEQNVFLWSLDSSKKAVKVQKRIFRVIWYYPSTMVAMPSYTHTHTRIIIIIIIDALCPRMQLVRVESQPKQPKSTLGAESNSTLTFFWESGWV